MKALLSVVRDVLSVLVLAAWIDIGYLVSHFINEGWSLDVRLMWRAYPFFLAIVVAIILAVRLVRFLQDSMKGTE